MLSLKIPIEVAQKLEIPPLSIKFQQENSFGFEFGLHREPLIERVKAILREYPPDTICQLKYFSSLHTIKNKLLTIY